MSAKGIYLESELLDSRAFRELTPTAIHVYLAFLRKRRFTRDKSKRGRKSWQFVNNGQLEFTYAEAFHKFGIKQGAFREARDLLVNVGLMDIAQSSAGLYKVKMLYGVSERWRCYGTAQFQDKPREKDSRHIGYQGRWLSLVGVGKETRLQGSGNVSGKSGQDDLHGAITGENVTDKLRRKNNAAEAVAASEKLRGSTSEKKRCL